MNKPATHFPSNYSGVFVHSTFNEDNNVQNQDKNQNAGEGSSREFQVNRDFDGYEIDLNFPHTLF